MLYNNVSARCMTCRETLDNVSIYAAREFLAAHKTAHALQVLSVEPDDVAFYAEYGRLSDREEERERRRRRIGKANRRRS